MSSTESKNFWESIFDITINDIDRIHALIEEKQYPVSIINIEKKVIRGRLIHGEDLSPPVLSDWSGKESIRLWDPAAEWDLRDNVIVVRGVSDTSERRYEYFFGVIKKIDLADGSASIDIGGEFVDYGLVEPYSDLAINIKNNVREIVASLANSSSLEDRISAVFTEFGGKIKSRLKEVLSAQKSFINIDEYWFLNEVIEDIQRSELMKIYKFISSLNKLSSLDEISNKISLTESEELIQKFMIKKALLANPNLFTTRDIKDGILYQINVPDINSAQIINFAYDPNTYEIICVPGEKPSQKTIDKLTDYGLLAGVIGSQTEVINGA